LHRVANFQRGTAMSTFTSFARYLRRTGFAFTNTMTRIHTHRLSQRIASSKVHLRRRSRRHSPCFHLHHPTLRSRTKRAHDELLSSWLGRKRCLDLTNGRCRHLTGLISSTANVLNSQRKGPWCLGRREAVRGSIVASCCFCSRFRFGTD